MKKILNTCSTKIRKKERAKGEGAYPALFLVADTQLYKSLCPSVGPSVRQSIGPFVCEHESKSLKTRNSAPAHPSATGGRVSGFVFNCPTAQNTFVLKRDQNAFHAFTRNIPSLHFFS